MRNQHFRAKDNRASHIRSTSAAAIAAATIATAHEVQDSASTTAFPNKQAISSFATAAIDTIVATAAEVLERFEGERKRRP